MNITNEWNINRNSQITIINNSNINGNSRVNNNVIEYSNSDNNVVTIYMSKYKANVKVYD